MERVIVDAKKEQELVKLLIKWDGYRSTPYRIVASTPSFNAVLAYNASEAEALKAL
jgi:hypothetical protein